MRRIFLLVLAFVAFGCGEQQAPPPPEVGVSPTPASQPPKQALAAPDFHRIPKLGVVRRSGVVKVGANVEDALTVFAEPRGSYEKSDLPPSIRAPFEARGWQAKGEGFGTILYNSRVAAAVYQLDRVNEERLTEILKLHQDAFGPPTKSLPGKYIRFWFWQDGEPEDRTGHLLMICATEVQPGRLNVTAAVGTVPVMEALGMTPESASSAIRVADKLIDKQRSSGKGNSSNSLNPAPP